MGEHDPDVEGDGRASQCRECGSVFQGGVNFCPDCGSAIEDALAAYCRVCGEAFEPDDRFCSDCGAVRNPSAEGRDARGSDVPGTPTADGSEDDPAGSKEEMAEFRRRVQSYLAEDWDIEHDYGDSVVLVDRGIGSIAVHVVLLFLTGGLGNLLYGYHCYRNRADRLHLSAGEDTPAHAHPDSLDDSDSTSTGRVVFGALLALGGLAMLVSNPLDLSDWIIGVPVLLGGLYLFPPTRRRIERRHPVTRFGSVRSTDETVVQSPDKPCVACGRAIDTGIRRTYREEKAVAGIPILTVRDGENHYCESCSYLGPDSGAGDPAVAVAESNSAPEREAN